MRFSPHKNRSNVCCCVYNCKSVAKKDETVRFHCLPAKGSFKVEIVNKFSEKELVDKNFAWTKILKLQNTKNLSKNARVCSLHFLEEDYEFAGIFIFLFNSVFK